MGNALDILRERGLVDDMTSDELGRVLGAPLTVYAGFDPTSRSLGLGNLVTIMVLAHLQRCGHRVVAVVGGATGMIGDPSGKSSERNLLSAEEIDKNVAGLRENLGRFLDFEHPTAPAIVLNNADWLSTFSYIDFLRDVGKHFRLGTMLGKESVRARLASEAGMSFTEFSYQLLQAYDFLYLHDQHGCTLQVGGSDQWGNITAGTDFVRRLRGVEVFGLTFPLLCDSSGEKFGKSEGNSVYLDAAMTSYYSFYQFFLRVADADVVKLLKIFTFLPPAEIEALADAVRSCPEERVAQKTLAEEVTRNVHGEHGLAVAVQASAVLFGAPLDGLRADDLLGIFSDVPSTELSLEDVAGAAVVDVASRTLCASKGAARRLIQGGGLYVNNRKVSALDETVGPDDLVEGRILLLRSGKKTFHVIQVVA